MKLRTLVTLLTMIPATLTGPQLTAQETRRTPTLEEYTSGAPSQLRPTSLRALQWLGNDYIYIEGTHQELSAPSTPSSTKTSYSP